MKKLFAPFRNPKITGTILIGSLILSAILAYFDKGRNTVENKPSNTNLTSHIHNE